MLWNCCEVNDGEKHFSDYSFSDFYQLVVRENESTSQEENYLFILEIPSIEIYQNVYPINNVLNDVSKNVELLQDSDLENHLVFLAAHSGSGSATYFNSLIFLEKGDSIFLNFLNKVDSYVVIDKYYILKNGYFEVGEVYSDHLFLITCSLDYSDRQLVVEAVLEK